MKGIQIANKGKEVLSISSNWRSVYNGIVILKGKFVVSIKVEDVHTWNTAIPFLDVLPIVTVTLIQRCSQKAIHGDIIFTGKYFTNDPKINQSIGDYLNYGSSITWDTSRILCRC